VGIFGKGANPFSSTSVARELVSALKTVCWAGGLDREPASFSVPNCIGPCGIGAPPSVSFDYDHELALSRSYALSHAFSSFTRTREDQKGGAQRPKLQTLAHWRGSAKTADAVRQEIARRWGDAEAKQYDPLTNCFTIQTWNKLGYRVKKDEKAIRSITYYDDRELKLLIIHGVLYPSSEVRERNE
jgi:hypothetical protein